MTYPDTSEARGFFSAVGQVLPATTVNEFDPYAGASVLMGLYFHLMEITETWLFSRGIQSHGARLYLKDLFFELATTAKMVNLSLAEFSKKHSTLSGLNQQVIEIFAKHNGPVALLHALDSVADRIRSTPD